MAIETLQDNRPGMGLSNDFPRPAPNIPQPERVNEMARELQLLLTNIEGLDSEAHIVGKRLEIVLRPEQPSTAELNKLEDKEPLTVLGKGLRELQSKVRHITTYLLDIEQRLEV